MNLINKEELNLHHNFVVMLFLIKDCVIVGVNDRLEIWSKANWDNYFSNNKESMADVADHLFEVDL